MGFRGVKLQTCAVVAVVRSSSMVVVYLPLGGSLSELMERKKVACRGVNWSESCFGQRTEWRLAWGSPEEELTEVAIQGGDRKKKVDNPMVMPGPLLYRTLIDVSRQLCGGCPKGWMPLFVQMVVSVFESCGRVIDHLSVDTSRVCLFSFVNLVDVVAEFLHRERLHCLLLLRVLVFVFVCLGR